MSCLGRLALESLHTVTSDFLPGQMTLPHLALHFDPSCSQMEHILVISPQNWLKKTGGCKPEQAGSLLCQATHRRSKYLGARSREVHAFLGRHVELCITPVADSVLWIPPPPHVPPSGENEEHQIYLSIYLSFNTNLFTLLYSVYTFCIFFCIYFLVVYVIFIFQCKLEV